MQKRLNVTFICILPVLFKFAKMSEFLTICYFSKFLHILMAMKTQKNYTSTIYK
jgi:hypothetical protein